MRLSALMQKLGAVVLLCGLPVSIAHAVEQVDISPCLAAVASDEVEKALAVCSAVIDNEKTAEPDRLKAMIARCALLARHGPGCSRARELDPNSEKDMANQREMMRELEQLRAQQRQ